ncbi:Amino acid adenylation, partial [Metarhizium majus ARSEF 297]
MPSSTIVSRDAVDAATLSDIARACDVYPDMIEDVYPCTDFQVNTMVESALRSSGFTSRYAFKLAHTVDLDRLCDALQQVVSLNAMLRTRIVDTRRGFVQVVTNQPHRTRRLSGGLDHFFVTDTTSALGLGEALFHSAIVNRRLALAMHHAITDNTAWLALVGDLVRIYRGQEPEPHRPFKGFVAWCRSIDDAAAKAFWASRFKGNPVTYPPVEPSYMPQATRKLSSLPEFSHVDAQVPLFQMPAYMELAWAMTLGAYVGSNVAYGVVLSGRQTGSDMDLPGLESVMGPTAVVVPVQARWSSASTVREMLKEVRASLRQLQTSPAMQYGLANIRASSEAARAASEFQAVLCIYTPLPEPCDTGELILERTDEPANPFGFSFHCFFVGPGVSVKVLYDPVVLGEPQMNRILNQFKHTLTALLEADLDSPLGSVTLLSRHDRSEILAWNGSAVPEPHPECLHDSFRAQAQRSPEATAVEARDGSVTYRELDHLSDSLAGELTRRRLAVESPVAVVFEKSMWMPVAVLGILKAGGACVPIHAADPPSRKEALIASAGAKMVLVSTEDALGASSSACDVLVVDKATISGFIRTHGAERPPTPSSVSPANIAYIVFTSGSTGTPKGVMLEHGCLQSALKVIIQTQDYEPGFRMMQFAAHLWDASIVEMLGTLLYGGCLCIPPEEERLASLADFIQSQRVESVLLTPTMLRSLSPDQVPGLRVVYSVGEPVDASAHRIWGRQTRLLNCWGPCEGGIANTMAHLTPDSPFPETIGRPKNCAVWIVHPENSDELCPIGATGELIIEGPGVARGYLNDAVKTKASFIPPPRWSRSLPRGGDNTKAARFYRTGDLGRYNPDGSISYLGRRDSQVKIRGQRFELGEVENVVNSSPEVRDVFLSTKIHRGRNELVAVISLADAQLPRGDGLRHLPSAYTRVVARHLQSIRECVRLRLPSYMVPTIWLAVEEVAHSASGKVDRHFMNDWLKAKDVSMAKAAMEEQADRELTPPATVEEKLVQYVWASVLDIPETSIGKESSFTRLGGDSIMAMQASHLLARSGIPVATSWLLRNQTLQSAVEAALLANVEEDEVAPVATRRPRDTSLGGLHDRLSRLSLSNPQFKHENIESIAPATDIQALFLTIGPPGVEGETGYHVSFTLELTPGLDAAKLRSACEQVVQHHAILRTAFVQHGHMLYQVVFKTPTLETVTIEGGGSPATPAFFGKGRNLARFHLFSRDELCDSLRLDIHHALYDSASFDLLLRDLDAAYNDGQLRRGGPRYHAWISHLEALDGTASRQFWIEVLRGSSMTHLAPPRIMPAQGYHLRYSCRLSVPLRNLQNSLGTPSTTFKAAWALVLSAALGARDVVFGEISANRYLTMPGIDQVCGPCINFVPVRAITSREATLASLIAQLQHQEKEGMQYHHLGLRSIIRDCTTWPSWTPVSTCISYQSHRPVEASVPIGKAKGVFSIEGGAAHAADVMIAAIPRGGELQIQLYYDADTVPTNQMNWIGQTLETIIQAIPACIQKSQGQIQDIVRQSTGTWPAATGSSLLSVGEAKYAPASSPSQGARDVVIQGWKELGLAVGLGDEGSMFADDADIVSAMLLSEYYQYRGYDVSIKDVIRHPSRLLQAHMLDGKSPPRNLQERTGARMCVYSVVVGVGL